MPLKSNECRVAMQAALRCTTLLLWHHTRQILQQMVRYVTLFSHDRCICAGDAETMLLTSTYFTARPHCSQCRAL